MLGRHIRTLFYFFLLAVAATPAAADALDDAIAFFNGIEVKVSGQPVDRTNVEKLQSPSLSQKARQALTDADLVHFAALPNLRSIDLSQSQVSEAGMMTLASMSTVTNVRLFGTTIGDAGLAALAAHPAIEVLDLDKTPITDAGLATLATYPKLRALTLNSTGVTAAGIAELSALGSLRSLMAANLKAFTPDMLPAIAKITGLTDLSLVGAPLDGALTGLAGSNVQRLTITGAKLTDADGVALGRLSALTMLSANDTGIGDLTIEALAGAPKLDTLHAAGTAITDAGGPGLARLSALKTLWLDRIAVTDTITGHLVGLPLQTLQLDKTGITDVGASNIAKISTLKSLALTGTQVTDAGATAIETAIPGIRIRR